MNTIFAVVGAVFIVSIGIVAFAAWLALMARIIGPVVNWFLDL